MTDHQRSRPHRNDHSGSDISPAPNRNNSMTTASREGRFDAAYSSPYRRSNASVDCFSPLNGSNARCSSQELWKRGNPNAFSLTLDPVESISGNFSIVSGVWSYEGAISIRRVHIAAVGFASGGVYVVHPWRSNSRRLPHSRLSYLHHRRSYLHHRRIARTWLRQGTKYGRSLMYYSRQLQRLCCCQRCRQQCYSSSRT
jgi:hypothetical protein